MSTEGNGVSTAPASGTLQSGQDHFDDPGRTGNVRADLKTVGCGFLMGAADIVPGVSGGTVALILGIYPRLVGAISRVDSRLLLAVTKRRWSEAATHLDLRFLAALGFGILAGIGSLASLMKHLLVHHRSLTYACFAGLIFASTLLVARHIHRWSMQTLGAALLGTIVALRLVTLDAMHSPPDTSWYLFLCGMIGITAMILPGISGAFILVLLQRYFYIVETLKELLHGNISAQTLIPVIVFSFGCLTGLLLFSRVLRWLLTHHEQLTMAILCGFMLGAMYCLWPFQKDTTPDETDTKRKVFVHVAPSESGSSSGLAGLLFVGSAGLVLGLDRIGTNMRKKH
ncbi:MAG: DUF368 domain-containing protein [Planctomycetaceae bacterium]